MYNTLNLVSRGCAMADKNNMLQAAIRINFFFIHYLAS